MSSNAVVLAALSLLVVASCTQPTDPVEPLVVPSTYDASGFTASTTAEMSLRASLSAMSTVMKAGRVPGTLVAEGSLVDAFAPLESSVLDAHRAYVSAALPQLALASGGSYDPRRPVRENGNGGVFVSYLFDETGLELEQVIEKGMYGAMLYHEACVLMTPNATAADVDRIVALFGADPSFPNSDKAASPDAFAAAYTARRDKNDGNGFYTTIAAALRKAQAAAKAGDAYDADLMQAFLVVRANWERAIMATVLNYLQSSATALSATTPTESSLASALHAHSEAVGFLLGFRTLPAAWKIISDTQIDAALADLRAPVDAPTSPCAFVTAPATTLPGIETAINNLALAYGFSAADLADFRFNWVSVQDRR